MRFKLALFIVTTVGVLALLPALAAAQESGIYQGFSRPVKFDISPPLRDIPPVPFPDDAGGLIPDPPAGPESLPWPDDVDPVVQTDLPEGEIPDPIVSFDAQPNNFGGAPPDPNGDVGPNHVVTMANLSFAVYDKTGTLLLGPLNNNTLWSGFGGTCEFRNDGDPVVLYDQLADRWLLTQFTASSPYFNCVALSTSPDPTGTYYRWAFSTGPRFPDYPKYGIWDDAYYISTREFQGGFVGVGAYAIDRTQMVAGNPSPTMISFLVPPGGTPYNVGDGLLPSDLDGSTLPPAGSPNYYVGSMDNGAQYGAPQDALTLWEFVADFATPPNSTFTLTHTIPVAAFDSQFPCAGRDCIPQPSTSNRLDILSYRQRPLHRLAYRNFGTHESLVTNQSVEAAPVMAGIRWYELRDPGGTPTIHQQGTFAPGITDGTHRWMASIAMDSAGNMAMGYSASSTSVFPSVWYTGRLAADPLGTMPQGEGSIIDGTGSQTSGGSRWGDYTSTTVDPIDDCTFWHVNEYLPTTSAAGWRLRVGAFRFDECGEPDFNLGMTPESITICAGTDAVYTVNVGSILGFTETVTLAASGEPAGSTTSFSLNPVPPPGSSDLTIGNTGGAAGGLYTITVDGTATGSPGHSSDAELEVFDSAPAAPTLDDPPDGAVNQPLTPTFNWTGAPDTFEYTIEIADDPGFSNIVDSATLSETTYTPASPLDPLTTYYWRVTPSNICGSGAVSATFDFTTLDPSFIFADGFESGDTTAWSLTVE